MSNHLDVGGHGFDKGNELDVDFGPLAKELCEMLVAPIRLQVLQRVLHRHHQEGDLQLHLPQSILRLRNASRPPRMWPGGVSAPALDVAPQRIQDAVMVILGAQLLHQLVEEGIHLGPVGDHLLTFAVESPVQSGGVMKRVCQHGILQGSLLEQKLEHIRVTEHRCHGCNSPNEVGCVSSPDGVVDLIPHPG